MCRLGRRNVTDAFIMKLHYMVSADFCMDFTKVVFPKQTMAGGFHE